ncbi:hypothetical protein BHF71_10460 [Vulcanibacillus modesticaldus]|uniref:Uncharacterized protein n=1 Tax=Vulcanibacillus modesticaldus TaxID=337097 RepID=A0A1D2YTF6_9BACI|nr:hypothetical protein [Vulcanibacillus modesticaldus]OEF98973.1 hypothetical protein BHF71_10460 [Vulcanibacillus modesticaldus]
MSFYKTNIIHIWFTDKEGAFICVTIYYFTYNYWMIVVILLFLGLKISTKKVFFVDSKWMFSFAILGFTPMMINSIFELIKNKSFEENWMSIITILMFLILLFVFKKSFGRLTIFNVTEDILYESLIEVFSKRGYTCEEKRSQILLKEVDATIKISINSLVNTATLNIINHHNIQDIKSVYRDLQVSLSQKIFKGRAFVGIVYILIGILLLVMLIGLLVMYIKGK